MTEASKSVLCCNIDISKNLDLGDLDISSISFKLEVTDIKCVWVL